MKKHNFKAFTLAEVMITLVVIGVITLMIMGAVGDVSPDENKLLYKKTFYTLSEVVRSLANDSNKFNSDDMFKAEPTNDEYASAQEYFCQMVANSLNTLGEIQCTGNPDWNFRLTNGVRIRGLNEEFTNEDDNALTAETITICVDVNGDKGPNTGCGEGAQNNANAGRDQFRIRISYDGKVYTGTNEEEFTVENSILGGDTVPSY